MKLYKKIVFIFLFSISLHTAQSQGVDVVFWLDNSGSIEDQEWADMSASVKTVIDQVLSCNPDNRVSVVNFGSHWEPGTTGIYIQSDFTNNPVVAKNFQRKGFRYSTPPPAVLPDVSNLGPFDYAHEALKLIGKALDGTSDPFIISTQKTLNKSTSNKLVVFLFTDAARAVGGTALTNPYLISFFATPTPGGPYDSYNSFKTDRGAVFVVAKGVGGDVSSTLLPESNAAAAAIASVGGSYMGAVDANAGDPQGNGTQPRRMIFSPTFSLSTLDITILSENICSAVLPVNFGALTASLRDGRLQVNWETFNETNNDHFDIEASADGTTFIKIGTVKSLASNGNSVLPLQYEFTGGINEALLGTGLVALLLGMSCFGSRAGRKRMQGLMILVIGVGICVSGCRKETTGAVPDGTKIFIRLLQADKDGTQKYSKVVQAARW